MIRIKSLLKEDGLDLDYNPFRVNLSQGKYIFYLYTDSGRDGGTHGNADIELRSGDPKVAAIDVLKRYVLDFLIDEIDYYDLDDVDEKELKRELIDEEYWFSAVYCNKGFWEVTGVEESLGQFHGSKSEFAGLFYNILKTESPTGDQVDLSGNELETYADDIMEIDAYNFDTVIEISIKKGGFGEFVDYVLDGGDPERFDVGTILTEG